MAKVGRPSKFDSAKCEQAEKLCKLGATDVELADFFGVSVSTLNNWKIEFPEFLESLKAGKAIADAEVASKLFRRASGYEHPEIHITAYQGEVTLTPITKVYPPDTTAAIFWLKNRRPDLWRDRVEHTGSNGADLIPQQTDIMEVARTIGFILASAEQSLH